MSTIKYAPVRRLTSIAAGLLFFFVSLNCDEAANEQYVPVCKWTEVQSCVGRTLGECEPGHRRCIETSTGSWWSACEGVVLPQEEVCDGLDNDCDNRIDRKSVV